jgi:hypothetical protein
VSITRSATRRSYAFEAIRQLRERFPHQSENELAAVLADSAVPNRSKAIILFYLQEFGVYEELVTQNIDPLRSLVDAVFRDVEKDEEDGMDPFRIDGFPNE